MPHLSNTGSAKIAPIRAKRGGELAGRAVDLNRNDLQLKFFEVSAVLAVQSFVVSMTKKTALTATSCKCRAGELGRLSATLPNGIQKPLSTPLLASGMMSTPWREGSRYQQQVPIISIPAPPKSWFTY
jgi:hypothetical protein